MPLSPYPSQQPAIEAFANLLLHRVDLGDKTSAVPIDGVACEIADSGAPIRTNGCMAISSGLRSKPRLSLDSRVYLCGKLKRLIVGLEFASGSVWPSLASGEG